MLLSINNKYRQNLQLRTTALNLFQPLPATNVPNYMNTQAEARAEAKRAYAAEVKEQRKDARREAYEKEEARKGRG